MALIPEFISILRYIRDTVYPSVNQTYENAVDLNKEITTKKNQFDVDYSQFKNDYEDFNDSRIEVNNAVTLAQQSAQSANNSAVIATNKSNEIKNLTAQGQTLTAGSQAYASYNPADGKLTIGIPAGLKGDKGDSFTINSSGTTAQRALYDNQIKGWSFLDLETSTIYFKVTDSSGDWSIGAPFGKGDQGPEGEEGIGIFSFTFVSTTDPSGLPAKSGATDTYRITLTNSNTFDYQIYNGIDADSDFILGELESLGSEVEQLIEDTSGLSNINAPYNLLKGEIYVDNTILTNGFNTTLYSGTSANTDIVTDVDMDTQWGNSSSEKFGGLVWLKSRNTATNNFLFDTIRDSLNEINSNTTDVNAVLSNSLIKFNNNGFTLGNASGINVTGSNYVSWTFGTTHRINGVTNHGKPYTCHYNPFTGFVIIKYEGSGLVGHEIPHHLGRKLDFITVKNLGSVTDWYAGNNQSIMNFNLTGSGAPLTSSFWVNTDTAYVTGSSSYNNQSGQQHIIYGWSNSYYDASNKLIGNYEIGTYNGTGASGNKIATRGKPAWVMIKRLNAIGSWLIFDNQRGIGLGVNAKYTFVESSAVEASSSINDMTFESNSFTVGISGDSLNSLGGQYLYIVVYDNDSGSGKSKYPKTTEISKVTIEDAVIPLANGIGNKGYINSIQYVNETLNSVSFTEGINYLYKTTTGFGTTSFAPNYGTTNPANGGDFYHIEKNKWFLSDGTPIDDGRNYLNCYVVADILGNLVRVEKLKKIIYSNSIKAKEFIGKNACTAWAIVDGSQTPPVFLDSFNFNLVTRTSTGYHKVSFSTLMDNPNFSIDASCFGTASICSIENATTSDITISTSNYQGNLGNRKFAIQVFGGKN